MAFLLGYCDIAFADAVNVRVKDNFEKWIDLTEAEKQTALNIARLFIDKSYTCTDTSLWDTDDYTTIPDEVQKANAILAEKYVLGELINYDIKKSGPIVKKRVKAGPVETETIYKGYYAKSGEKEDVNKEVTLLLSPYCSLGSSQRDLIRV